MGGNAIKSSVRLSKSDYEIAKNQILQFFWSRNIKVAVPPSYSSKSDFGDLDVLVENTGNMKETIEEVNKFFNVKESFKNSTVYSFGFDYNSKIFQVDLIFVTSKDFETSYNYLSYNDLFNLLGRLAHKLGFKLGHQGLIVPVKNGNYTLGDVIVTKDLKEIFNIIDVDYEVFQKGFESPTDIFDFVIASKYFTSKMYELEELNNINRVRNKKRKIYMNFVEYIKDIEPKEIDINKDTFVKEVLKRFPEAEKECQKLLDRLAFQQAVSEKFNGNIVKDVTGLEGVELGMLIKKLKNKYSDEFWLSADVVEIIKSEM